MSILDPTTRQTVSFIPVYLEEGETSPAYPVVIVPDAAGSFLGGNLSDKVTLQGRIAPGAFQNLASNPINLAPYFGSEIQVELRVVAAAPLPGVTRVYISAGIGKPAAAAWQV